MSRKLLKESLARIQALSGVTDFRQPQIVSENSDDEVWDFMDNVEEPEGSDTIDTMSGELLVAWSTVMPEENQGDEASLIAVGIQKIMSMVQPKPDWEEHMSGRQLTAAEYDSLESDPPVDFTIPQIVFKSWFLGEEE